MNATVYLMLLACSAVPPESARPSPVAVSVPDGTVLVGLARGAMNDYLALRTPAAAQALPPSARHLAPQRLGACVTLRREGRIVGRSLHIGDSLPRNVITASLEAMRSPLLPDIVTAKVLDSLTVEVEVLGAAQLVARPPATAPSRGAVEGARSELSGAVAPGLTGLVVTRGRKSGCVTPAQAYQESMGLDEMIRAALLQVPPGGEDKDLPLHWSLFESRHFVGFPDGRVVWLLRGKIPIPDEAIDEAMLKDAALLIGKFLARHQDRNGTFRLHGQGVSREDQIRLTGALALLASQDKSFEAPWRHGLEALGGATAGPKEPSLDEALQNLRANLGPASRPSSLAQVLSLDAPVDAFGGFAAGGRPPETVLTAWAVRGGAGKATSLPAEMKPADVLAARRFCYKMVCKAREAFYDADDAGGVRESPASPRISAGACAAAIEALLAGGK